MRISPTPLELNPTTRNDPARIDQVARQLEGQFAQMLIKSMRDASFGDSLFPGENPMFREMYDKQLAEQMTKGRGLGLSAVIARQLGGDQGATQPSVDTSIKPAGAARSYQLAAPAAVGLPLPASATAPASVDPLALAPRVSDPSLLPLSQTLDLIAGRESSQLHQQLQAITGDTAAPGATATANIPAWAMADDRWSNVAPRSTAVDSVAASAAVAQLGSHTPEGFVASIWPQAQQAARELGVNPRALVAQAALETGWGKRNIRRADGSSSNNLFGIKATGWQGERVAARTHEFEGGVRRTETANFRAYRSVADSFGDYVRMLKTSPRYQQALRAGGDVHGFARGLQEGGYATDPSYANKIAAIANGPTVERAVAAISDAGTRLGRNFASTASLAGAGVTRR